jgi:LysR family hydrogen peroxide-inducible transcriptional activator
VPGIRARFPKLELLLVEEKSDVILSRLREGRLDAGLLALPIHDDQLHVEFLFEEPFLLAVPETHALAKRSHLVLADLADERLLLLEDGHCLRDQALGCLPTRRRGRNARLPGDRAWKRCGRWSRRMSA